MDESEYERLCAVFLRAFASVPEPLRSEIIVAVDGKPYTWESVFVEVKAKTRLSRAMLELLKKLGVIK